MPLVATGKLSSGRSRKAEEISNHLVGFMKMMKLIFACQRGKIFFKIERKDRNKQVWKFELVGD
jgi:hypothetical protein